MVCMPSEPHLSLINTYCRGALYISKNHHRSPFPTSIWFPVDWNPDIVEDLKLNLPADGLKTPANSNRIREFQKSNASGVIYPTSK